MLGQRHRRWASIRPGLGQCLLLAGLALLNLSGDYERHSHVNCVTEAYVIIVRHLMHNKHPGTYSLSSGHCCQGPLTITLPLCTHSIPPHIKCHAALYSSWAWRFLIDLLVNNYHIPKSCISIGPNVLITFIAFLNFN